MPADSPLQPASRPAVLGVVAVSVALAYSTWSGTWLRPLLDVEVIRSVPYLRSGLITLGDIVVFLALTCLALRRSPGFVLGLSGLAAPVHRPAMFAALILIPALAFCLAVTPLSQESTFADFAWKGALGPWLEEVLYRGLAIGVLVRLCGWPWLAACLWPALFFGVAHASQGAGFGEVAGIVGITAAGGLMFGWLYVRWGYNLWPAVFLHLVLNTLWMAFDFGENAIGGGMGNAVRTGVVIIAIFATLRLAPKSRSAAVRHDLDLDT